MADRVTLLVQASQDQQNNSFKGHWHKNKYHLYQSISLKQPELRQFFVANVRFCCPQKMLDIILIIELIYQ